MKIGEYPDNPEYVFGNETEIISVKRGEYVLAPLQIEKYLYFVVDGCIGSFIDGEKESHCIGFYTKGNFFSEYVSFISQNKSKSYSRALKSSTLARVHRSVLYAAYETSMAHQERGRMVAETIYASMHERTCDLLSLKAEERYLKLLRNKKDELHEVPLKIIASYLGMTDVTLSRIRRKISRIS